MNCILAQFEALELNSLLIVLEALELKISRNL